MKNNFKYLECFENFEVDKNSEENNILNYKEFLRTNISKNNTVPIDGITSSPPIPKVINKSSNGIFGKINPKKIKDLKRKERIKATRDAKYSFMKTGNFSPMDLYAYSPRKSNYSTHDIPMNKINFS